MLIAILQWLLHRTENTNLKLKVSNSSWHTYMQRLNLSVNIHHIRGGSFLSLKSAIGLSCLSINRLACNVDLGAVFKLYQHTALGGMACIIKSYK